MHISEAGVSTDELANITTHAYRNAPMLGLESSALTPEAITVWADSTVYDWQQGNPPKQDADDAIATLGTIWAEQIIKKHGWYWVSLIFHDYDDWESYAIVSTDRSLMILPFAFIHECISDGIDVTIAASLSAIGSEIIPTFEPNSYTNVMHGLQRIIPR